ncbi:MAG TPA: PEP-CTERM sorting domain-containing protein, partial [Candidatus Solibacter sp.]|nr:PEP-CTERM sorting domain-containing protein [Candidatus Solibacter sp.]
PTQDPADLLTMTVTGGNPFTGNCDNANLCTLVFGEWSEDPGGIPSLVGYNVLGPFDETLPDNVPGSHPPLIDLFGLRGATVRFTDFNGVVQTDTLTEIDFKSDPPVPEPGAWLLVTAGVVCLWRKRWH